MGSNLDIFKIGIGPSSSHTLGPIIAALRFLQLIDIDKTTRVCIELYGSLSLTGRGHLSDMAVIWGLSGIEPINLDEEQRNRIKKEVFEQGILKLGNKKNISFRYECDLIFKNEFLPLHENALRFYAYEGEKLLKDATFYSVGGGLVKYESELKEKNTKTKIHQNIEINSAEKILEICQKDSIDLATLAMRYELQFRTSEEINAYLSQIWEIMQEVFYSGTHPKSDILPGPLKLHRRAIGLQQRTIATTDPIGILDFISLYAIAIAEENASGARVITAPTNGACAVIPAVMLYLKNHTIGFSEKKAIDFLLVCTLIGGLYRNNASISGAEAGCQAEIGSASSMAAAAMATTLGANAQTACNAAEIAMEHHLGLTCDPVGGLVQIPCIERNAFGAIKAIMASRMAMSRKSKPVVSLDQIIKTMYETGKDIDSKYRETALGGLSKSIGC